MAERRKSFISGLFRASDAKYMNPALYQSGSLHFGIVIDIYKAVSFGIAFKQLLLICDGITFSLHFIITT